MFKYFSVLKVMVCSYDGILHIYLFSVKFNENHKITHNSLGTDLIKAYFCVKNLEHITLEEVRARWL